jgi:hypothetical protein
MESIRALNPCMTPYLIHEYICIGHQIMRIGVCLCRARWTRQYRVSVTAWFTCSRRTPNVVSQVMLFDHLDNITLLRTLYEWFRSQRHYAAQVYYFTIWVLTVLTKKKLWDCSNFSRAARRSYHNQALPAFPKLVIGIRPQNTSIPIYTCICS